MIEQTAKVVSIKQGYAWVEPATASGCGNCKSAKSCSPGLFSFMKPSSETIQVQNPLRARPGDEVVIGMQANALLVYSLFAYLLPLLSMIVFAVLGQALFEALGMHADMGAIMAGIGGLLSGLKLAGWLAKGVAVAADAQPVILRHKEHIIHAVDGPVTPA